MTAQPLPRAVIIIPTYNESATIGRLIDEFYAKVFPAITAWDMHVLVVDAHSPDDTARIVEGKKSEHENVHLLIESGKNGIGSAYMEGFAYAMQELRTDVVIEFDGDFQHPPEIIPILLAKLDEGYDYVAASRMIPGGSEPKGRSFLRILFTECGGLLARFILFFPSKDFSMVTDPTTGLKATRVKGFLDQLDVSTEHLYSKKFGYKIQMLSETLATDARYAEVPLQFGHRAAGVSKIEPGTALEILLVCVRTRLNAARPVV